MLTPCPGNTPISRSRLDDCIPCCAGDAAPSPMPATFVFFADRKLAESFAARSHVRRGKAATAESCDAVVSLHRDVATLLPRNAP